MQNIIIGFLIAVILGGGGFFLFSQNETNETGLIPQEKNTELGTQKNVPTDEKTTIINSDGANNAVAEGPNSTSETPQTIVVNSAFNTSAIPLGDGKISSSPKKGYVYSCQQTFSPNAGGAQADGSWIHGSTWNLNEKISVQGKVYWNSAVFSTLLQNTIRKITGNGLPVGEPTGTFPVATNDPAYQIDRNPNKISAKNVSYELPANPTIATTPTCVPMGAIGVTTNGVAIFNALDGRGEDAVAHEVQDLCNGHPEQTGEYHFHGPSDCIPGADSANTLVGYALDGFGIFSRFDANGNEYTNADLDECHGTTSTILWNGIEKEMYHYVLTQEYPYTIGCFRGTPIVSTSVQTQGGGSSQNGGQQSGTPQGGGSQSGPPQEAISACSGKTTNASCSFTGGMGTVSGTCRQTPEGVTACVP